MVASAAVAGVSTTWSSAVAVRETEIGAEAVIVTSALIGLCGVGARSIVRTIGSGSAPAPVGAAMVVDGSAAAPGPASSSEQPTAIRATRRTAREASRRIGAQ